MRKNDMSLVTQENDLSARIQVLEDIEEIRRLKFLYGRLCDDGFDVDGLSEVFTEDAVWTVGEEWGSYVGIEAIINFFRTMPDAVSFSVHALSNGEIDVDGDSAKARWRTLIPCSVIEENSHTPHWMFCDYYDEYRKVNGRWLFSRIHGDVTHNVPHKDGW